MIAAVGMDMLFYDDQPSVLLFADDSGAREAAGEAIAAIGGRLAATLPLAVAAERIGRQAAIDMVVVEVTADVGEPLDRLLLLLEEGARDARFPSVVTVPPGLIDVAAARAPTVTLLSAPAPGERAAALTALLAARRLRLNDVGSDGRAPRLRELSEEVGRIARTLARLSGDTGPAPSLIGIGEPEPRGVHDEIVDATLVRAMIRARRLRDQYFSGEIFADPAWDMLLDLTAARLERRQVAVSSLCIAAAVPPTTALRWIKTLTDEGLLVRVADPRDGRRVFITLSESAAAAMLGYLGAAKKVTALPV